MSGKLVKTSEEMKRRNNIAKFLEGLFEDDRSISESNLPSFISRLRITSNENYVKCIHYLKSREKMSNLVAAEKQKSCFAKFQYLSANELRALRAHPEILKKFRENILRLPMSIHNLKENDTLVRIYTGLPNVKAFFHLADMFPKGSISYYHGWVVGQLTIKEQLLMTLIKLRLNIPDLQLSHRFKCSMETVMNTLHTWIYAIHEKLYDVTVTILGSMRDPCIPDGPMVLHTMTVYKEVPDNPHLPHKTPSEPYTTVLLSTASGTVVYASEMFRRMGYKYNIVQYCGVLEILIPGDVVVVNKDVTLDLPDGVTSRNIDLALRWLKDSRDDLKRRLMEFDIISSIPPSLWECAPTVWQVVVALTNHSHFNAF